MTAIAPTTFRVDVPDSVLADLRERLARTRFPDQAPGAPWAYGADLGYVKDLCEYWRERYDWRKHEAALNGFRQFTARVAGIDLHFIHEEGRGPKPLPLLLSHGWPGSIWEFHKIIPMLTDPARFGGDPADAFTVVAPSLPGYGFSFAPGQARFGITEIADAFAVLMTDVLSYRRFAAQGGDWGGFITSRLGVAYPERLAGIHLTPEEFDAVEVVDREYRHELIDGRLIVTPPPVAAQRGSNETLGHRLLNFRDSQPQGSALDGTLPEHTVVTLTNRRHVDRVIWAGLGRQPNPKVDLPSIVAEWVSESKRDWLRDYVEKNQEYRELGIAEYWIFDRFRRTLTVYQGTPDAPEELVVHEGETYRTPLLPGFELPLSPLLAVADRWG